MIPISTPLVRLYSDYMLAEYRDLDSDYVFVNLWGGAVGRPLSYHTVHKLVARIPASGATWRSPLTCCATLTPPI